MKLNLKTIIKTADGRYKEIFSTDNSEIKEVAFEYVGSEDKLTEFLKVLVFDYARKKKYID